MTQSKIEQAIDQLASLYEYGHLEASANPAGFLERVHDEIVKLRELASAVQLAHEHEGHLKRDFCSHREIMDAFNQLKKFYGRKE